MSTLDRPRLITHNVSSLDGKLQASGVPLVPSYERSHGWSDVTDMWALHEPHVQLEGSNSFVGRDAPAADLPPAPRGVILHRDYLPEHIVAEHPRFFAVVDSRGRVRWTQKVGGRNEQLLILVSRATPSAYLAFLRDEDIPYLIAGDERVDLRRALGLLAERLGVTVVVATGGGLLNGVLLRAGLVDEVDIDYLPVIVGGDEAPVLFEGLLLRREESPVVLMPIEMQQKPSGGMFVRFAVKRRT